MADWDRRFINLADHIAQWSRDPSTKVGAVITDDKNTLDIQGNKKPQAG
jgi:dCMP deaminase